MAEDTLSLLDELDAEQSAIGGRCNATTVLASLDDEARAEWEAAMRNPKYTAASIFRAAQRRGVPFTEQSLTRHVRRMRIGQGCLCPR